MRGRQQFSSQEECRRSLFGIPKRLHVRSLNEHAVAEELKGAVIDPDRYQTLLASAAGKSTIFAAAAAAADFAPRGGVTTLLQ